MTKTDPEPSLPLPLKPVSKEDKEIAKDFLLAEHNVIKEFFQEDLKVAEKRVNFLIKISGGAIAFIGVLIGLEDSSIIGGTYVGYTQILIVGSFLTLVILVFGYSTLVRIAFMNVNHQKWMKRLGILRKKFRKLSPILEEGYFPFRADRDSYYIRKESQNWDRGGLNSVMLRLNAFILVVLTELIAELIRSSLSIENILWICIPVLLAICCYSGGIYCQKWVINQKSKEWEEKVKRYIEELYARTEEDWKLIYTRTEEDWRKIRELEAKKEGEKESSD